MEPSQQDWQDTYCVLGTLGACLLFLYGMKLAGFRAMAGGSIGFGG